jgi:hypothetical protein
LSAGDLSSTGTGTITLIGTSSAFSAGTSDGIIIDGGTITTGSGSVSLTGTAPTGATGASNGVRLSSTGITTTGAISVTGTSHSTGTNSYGVYIPTLWTVTSTSIPLAINGTGGLGSASHGIDVSANIVITAGNGGVVFTGTPGSGSGSFGINFDPDIRTAGGPITVIGSTLLSAATRFDTTNSGGTPAGANILFSGSGSTIDGGFDFNLRAGTSGTVTFQGLIGSITPVGNLTIVNASTSANAVNLYTDISAETFVIDTASPVTLRGPVTITTTGVTTFGSTVDGAQPLVIDAGGTVSFPDTVGLTAALTSIVVTAPLIDVDGSQTVSSGPMTYNGPVTLLSAGTFTDTGANGITFESTLTGNFPLTVTAPRATVLFEGTVDTSGVADADAHFISVTASGDITANGDLLARGGAASEGNPGRAGAAVTLTSSNGSIFINHIDNSGSDAMTGDGGNARSITLQAAAGYSTGSLGNIPNGIIHLRTGTIGDPTLKSVGGAGSGGFSDGVSGNIFLDNAGRAAIMSIATIVSSPDPGNDVFISGGSLFVGQYEAFTILGELNITMDTLANVGDVITTGPFTITSPQILLDTHGTGNLLSNLGFLYQTFETHFFSPMITLSTPPTPPGPLEQILTTLTFADLLYAPDNYILNYDLHTNPSPPPLPPLPYPFIFKLLNAEAEFESRLPVVELGPYPNLPRLCPISLDNPECPRKFFEFEAFIQENKVH